MGLKIHRPRGTMDMLPPYMAKWRHVEHVWRSVTKAFAYGEIVTPMFERTELFSRSAGETSDVVSKEMYTFLDRGGRQLSLRPEGTAAVARAYLEEELATWPQPVKLFYVAPMFRYERPQAGRYRQHVQYGVEVIGSAEPFTDAEVISLITEFYQRLGIGGIHLNLNSIGDTVCRPIYRKALLDYVHNVRDHLCDECKERIERNPLRVLDCKNESCQVYLQMAPRSTDYLCDACRTHFDTLRTYLDDQGVSYVINPRLVRGLDYYTRTTFEVHSSQLGAQTALAGGGRYDGLIDTLGGPPTPAIGFGAGMERLLFVMDQLGIAWPDTRQIEVFVIALGAGARKQAEALLQQLRQAGISSDIDHLRNSKIKAQLVKATRLQARLALIVGEEELQRSMVGLRDLETTSQHDVPLDKVVPAVQTALATQ